MKDDKQYESKSSKLELEGSQGSCLISILPFPSNHRGRWGCWGSAMPSLSPLPPKNVRTRASVKVNLSKTNIKILSSVSQFSRSVVSNSLWPHESQHTRRPCPSPTPRVHSDSHPSSQWCHPAISSSVVPFSSCPQSLPASESFPMRGLRTCSKTLIPIKPSFLKYYLTQWLINCQYMVNYCNLISSTY